MRYYVVDAFTDTVFSGNPAGVCLPDRPLDPALMQRIAAENNLSETAFALPRPDGDWDLRWFTPGMEIDLCGHATLGTAYILYRYVCPGADTLRFHTQSGPLEVVRRDGRLEMDFPARMPRPVPVTEQMRALAGAPVAEAHLSRDLLLLLEDERAVRELRPRLDLAAHIPDTLAVIVTARGDEADFVSRFFAPEMGVPEDPVTGSAHATLIPFWAGRLGRDTLVPRQLSPRGGTLYCRNAGERVKIAGEAALYLEGEILP